MNIIGIHSTSFSSGHNVTTYGSNLDERTAEAVEIIERVTGKPTQPGKSKFGSTFWFVSDPTPEQIQIIKEKVHPDIIQYLWIGSDEDEMYRSEMGIKNW